VRLTNGVRLILETKGHDELEEVKAQAAERWVRAVNADGSCGEWRYAVAHDPNHIPALLTGS
jgi:type III restriction enzyme